MERFDVFTFDGKTFLVDQDGIFYLKQDGLSGLGNTKLSFPRRIPFGLPDQFSQRIRQTSVIDPLDKIRIKTKGPGVIDPNIKIEKPKIIPIKNVKKLGRPKPDFLNAFSNLAKSVGTIFGNKRDMVNRRTTTATVVNTQPINNTPTNTQPTSNGGLSKTAIVGIAGAILIGGAIMMKKKAVA